MTAVESSSNNNKDLTADVIYSILAAVKDPEIPVISIQDLGILQQVHLQGDAVKVDIIPTYSGCPAMHAIKTDIKAMLLEHGITDVEVNLVGHPIWNTDMITEQGRAAMKEYGIAPPLAPGERLINCPQCGSDDTSCISEFGSTACKALYRCKSCLEPFDYFKCHV